MRRILLTAILLVLLPVVGRGSDVFTTSENTLGITLSRGDADRVMTWLRESADFVFLGRFVSAGPDSSRRGRGPDITCKVETVLSGYPGGRVVTFSRLIGTTFAPRRLHPGTRVLVRVTRCCTRTNGPCGSFYVIGRGGVLLSDYIDSDANKRKNADGRPLRLRDLHLKELRKNGLRPLLARASGLAVATLADDRHVTTTGRTWPCMDAEWAVPSSDSMPAFVRFPERTGCFLDSPPLRFLIPVPCGFAGDTLTVDCCPHLLRIKDGMVAGLGVRVEDLRTVVTRTRNGGLDVAVAEREETRR